jgi:hypothetical protein
VSKSGWYLRETTSGPFYTPTCNKKAKRYLVGTGEDKPTPKEIFEMLEKHPNLEMDMGGNLMTEWDASDTNDTVCDLPGGFYVHEPPGHYEPEKLIPTTLRDDNVTEIPDTFDPIVNDIRTFLQGEEIYRDIGVQYRRGLLLYGPPGEGKTTMIRTILKKEIPSDAIIVWLEKLPTNDLIRKFKELESGRLKVFVFEELVSVIETLKMERLLDFLDGERSIDKSLIIGTTNYPERLPSNIVDRPSRFDKLYKVGSASKNTRKAILSHYLSKQDITDEEVELTKGYSIAAIKEACLYARLRNISLSDSIKKIKEHKELVKNDFAEQRHTGFGLSALIDD